MTRMSYVQMLSWETINESGAGSKLKHIIAMRHDPNDCLIAGSTIQLRALSGMDFPASVNASDPSKYKQRILILPDGTQGKIVAAGIGENVGLLNLAVPIEVEANVESSNEFNHLTKSITTPRSKSSCQTHQQPYLAVHCSNQLWHGQVLRFWFKAIDPMDSAPQTIGLE